jgi:hypothetical protein
MQLAATGNSNPTLVAATIFLDDVDRTARQALQTTEPSQLTAFAVTAIEQATEATELFEWASREAEGREGFMSLQLLVEDGVIAPLTAARDAASAGNAQSARDAFHVARTRIAAIVGRL